MRDGEIKDDNYKFDEKGKLIRPDRKNMGKISSSDLDKEKDSKHNYYDGEYIPSPECYRLSESISTSEDTATNSKRKRSEENTHEIDYPSIYNKKSCVQPSIIKVIEGSNGIGCLYLGVSSNIDKADIERLQIKSIMNCFNDIPQYFNEFIQNMFISKPNIYELSLYKFISKSITVIRVCILNGQNILIHCDERRFLSSSIVAAYLLEYENVPLYKTKEYLYLIDPNLKLNIEFLHGLIEMEKDLIRNQIRISIETTIHSTNEPTHYMGGVHPSTLNVHLIDNTYFKKSEDNEKVGMETVMPSELITYTSNLTFSEEHPLL